MKPTMIIEGNTYYLDEKTKSERMALILANNFRRKYGLKARITPYGNGYGVWLCFN